MMTRIPQAIASHRHGIGPGAKNNRRLGERGDFKRARKINWPAGSVVTDGAGNITSRPLQRNLPCFADVVEWLRGKWDTPTRYKGYEQERLCGGCPVAAWCGKVAQERMAANAVLGLAHDAWVVATDRLDPEDRYRHPAWAELVDAYEMAGFADSNDAALEADNQRRAQERHDKKLAHAKAKRKAARRKARNVPKATAGIIDSYRDERLAELDAARAKSNPPLWLRNRSPERVKLIPDAWAAREMLEASGVKASVRAVAASLLPGRELTAADVRAVFEALRRADRLVAKGSWPKLKNEPVKLRGYGYGMNPGTVHTLIDEQTP